MSIAYLGDGERALALADEALAIALERVPPAASLAHVARADALIALGRHAEAHAPLDAVDLMMLPEPDRTFLMGASRTIRSRLALAEGDVDGAEAIARGLRRGSPDERGCGSGRGGPPRAGASTRRCRPVRGGPRRSRSSRSSRRSGSGSAECSGRRWRCRRTCTLGSVRSRWRAISVAGRARSSTRSPPDSPMRTFGVDSSCATTSAPSSQTDGDRGGSLRSSPTVTPSSEGLQSGRTREGAGGPPGTRTPNLRIKSPLLCQIELEARRSVATTVACPGSRRCLRATRTGDMSGD